VIGPLLYDSRLKKFKEKLLTKLFGPYLVEKSHENGSIHINTIDEE